MARLDGYMAGCNLGHWISQYGNKGAEHHSTYITKPDFRRMVRGFRRAAAVPFRLRRFARCLGAAAVLFSAPFATLHPSRFTRQIP